MIRIASSSLFLLLALALGAAVAAEPARDMQELMHKSGLHKQLAQIQENLRAQSARARAESQTGNGPALDDDMRLRLERGLDRVYSPERMRQAVSTELARTLSREDEKEVIAWLDSPLGKRFTAIEEAKDTGDFVANARAAAAYAQTASKARLDLGTRMAAALNTGESTVNMLVNLTTAMVYGMSMVTPKVDETAVRAVRERLESQRPQAAKTFQELAARGFAYTYREVPEADFARYVEFAESPAGLRYHDATIKALDVAFARSSIELGRELGGALSDDPKRRL